MNPPVPYTREAIARMRQGATAVDLGWDQATYQRRARHHGIEVAPSAIAAAVPEPDPDLIRWDVRTGEFARGKVRFAMPDKMARIFDVLHRRFAAGDLDYMPTTDLLAATRIAYQTKACKVIAAFNDRARPCGLRIENAIRRGYRLVVSESCAVASASSPQVKQEQD